MIVSSLVLSLSKGERFGSWFDRLTTSVTRDPFECHGRTHRKTCAYIKVDD
jgi:hypothetical protein